MKRTVDISTRYQPVIDFYKGYNNAEFNVLSSNLLCQYQLFYKQKDIDLLSLLECLKSYDFTLTDLLIVLTQNFEKIPKEKIKEINDSILSDENVDNTGIKQTRKKRKIAEPKVQQSFENNKPEIQVNTKKEEVLEDPLITEEMLLRQILGGQTNEKKDENLEPKKVEEINTNSYYPYTQKEEVEYNPYTQPTRNNYIDYREEVKQPEVTYQPPVQQVATPVRNSPLKSEVKKNNRPMPRKFTLAEMGLDLSD